MPLYCLCRHPKESHHTTMVNGRVVPFCGECETCNGFGVIAPRPPRSMLLDAIPAAEPTEVAAADDGDNEEPGSVAATLLYAWDAALCTSCEWRTSAAVKVCLQCGAALTPVTIQMHSRESG